MIISAMAITSAPHILLLQLIISEAKQTLLITHTLFVQLQLSMSDDTILTSHLSWQNPNYQEKILFAYFHVIIGILLFYIFK